MSADTCGGPQKALNPLELELQAVMSHSAWVLGPEHMSSGRAAIPLTTEPSLQPANECFKTKYVNTGWFFEGPA